MNCASDIDKNSVTITDEFPHAIHSICLRLLLFYIRRESDFSQKAGWFLQRTREEVLSLTLKWWQWKTFCTISFNSKQSGKKGTARSAPVHSNSKINVTNKFIEMWFRQQTDEDYIFNDWWKWIEDFFWKCTSEKKNANTFCTMGLWAREENSRNNQRIGNRIIVKSKFLYAKILEIILWMLQSNEISVRRR